LGYISVAESLGYIFNHFNAVRAESYQVAEITQKTAITPFKVTDFDINRNLIYDFLLVINTNLPSVLHRFRDIAFDSSKIAIFG